VFYDKDVQIIYSSIPWSFCGLDTKNDQRAQVLLASVKAQVKELKKIFLHIFGIVLRLSSALVWVFSLKI